MAGVVNAAKQSHVQMAGIVNGSRGRNRTQLAGVVNTADTSSLQIASIVNTARHAGTQIGLVNVADTVGGVAIGLLNVVRRGGLHELEVSSRFFSASKNNTPDISVAYRLGMPRFYTFAEVSYNTDLWMAGIGAGTQVNIRGRHGLNFELLSQNVIRPSTYSWLDWKDELTQLRVLYHYRFARYFALFGGPTLNFSYNYKNNVLTDTRIGFSVGVRL
jgi:hypothetical protein